MRSALLALLIAIATGGCRRDAEPPPVLPIGGDFVLTDHGGRRFESASLRGKVVLVFFGYTFCPDVCPTTLSKLSVVARALGGDADRVKTLYITVDPARDTPEVLSEHLSMFGVDAVGLTGTPDKIQKVASQFGVAYEIEEQSDSEAKYLVSHSTTLYAIDAQGRTRLLFPYEATVDQIVRGVRTLL